MISNQPFVRFKCFICFGLDCMYSEKWKKFSLKKVTYLVKTTFYTKYCKVYIQCLVGNLVTRILKKNRVLSWVYQYLLENITFIFQIIFHTSNLFLLLENNSKFFVSLYLDQLLQEYLLWSKDKPTDHYHNPDPQMILVFYSSILTKGM